ncbi:small-subunit processome [Obba rivulosa]|uniref:Small-subunit processome n=1 Tax=Obba rivulosa TaxID=1052685 RepID=A0A8E2J729_9APHY|nr:small-subunit processome [Obba rivulosa]
MSSLRNSLHRRNHKERSQLSHRSRLGILEKHKDYVLRARDYHSKKDRLHRLRQKAADRNKDEFYFAMTRQKTQGGVHIQDRGNAALPTDIVKVLKTQDENYLRTMRAVGLKKIDKIKGQLSALADLIRPGSLGGDEDVEDELDEGELQILTEAGIISPPAGRRRKGSSDRKGKHIVFVADESEAREYSTASRSQKAMENDDAMDEDENAAELGWKTPEPTKKSMKRRSRASLDDENTAHAMEEEAEEQKESAKEHRTRLLKELSARLFRDRQLRYAERELEMQRLLMGKGGAQKLKGVEKVEGDDEEEEEEDEDAPSSSRRKVDEKTWKPRVYKWRVERKR